MRLQRRSSKLLSPYFAFQINWSILDNVDLTSKMIVSVHVMLFMFASLPSIYLSIWICFCSSLIRAKVRRWRKNGTDAHVPRRTCQFLGAYHIQLICAGLWWLQSQQLGIWDKNIIINNAFQCVFIFPLNLLNVHFDIMATTINTHSRLHIISTCEFSFGHLFGRFCLHRFYWSIYIDL